MKKFFTKLTGPKKGQKGFTLIELLIVIAILGILAAIAIPNVASFIKSGNESAANSELASAKLAAIAYVAAESPTGAFDESSISDYMDGSVTGDYDFDSNGALTGASYTGMTYNSTTNLFDAT